MTIFIIDDDPSIRTALTFLFKSVGLEVKVFNDPQEYLDQLDLYSFGCLIIDIRLPIMSGLTLLHRLKTLDFLLPIIVMTGYSEIDIAIEAMKLGAKDFVVKPFNNHKLIEIVQNLLLEAAPLKNVIAAKKSLQDLTDKELKVLRLLAEGLMNKEIAGKLSISSSTVEAHRAHIMEKMHARTIAQLVKNYMVANS